MPDPTFDLVIFDNDGVLIDSEKLAARGNAELLTGLGYPMTAEDCERRFAGLSDRDMVAELRAEGVPLPDDFIEQMYAISEHAFLTELEPIAGVRSVVELAQSRAAIAVASNAPRANVLRNLTTTGYDDLIPAFIVSGDTSKVVKDARLLDNCTLMSKPIDTNRLLSAARLAVRTGEVPLD